MANFKKQLVSSYNTLPEMPHGGIARAIERFSMAHTLNENNFNELHGALNVRPVKEFKAAVEECLEWLRRKVAGREYRLIIERNSDAEGVKSSTWLAPHVERILGPPRDIIVVERAKPINLGPRRGPREDIFVHLDDALYTGRQKHDLLRLLSLAEQKRGGHGCVFMTAPYATAQARDLVSSYKSKYLDVEFERKHVIRLTKNSLPTNILSRLEKRGLFAYTQNRFGKHHTTMTILPHKVANYISFGFHQPRAQNGGLSTSQAVLNLALPPNERQRLRGVYKYIKQTSPYAPNEQANENVPLAKRKRQLLNIMEMERKVLPRK